MPSTVRRWSESKHANSKPLVLKQKENAHLIDLEWTEKSNGNLKTVPERYTAQGS